MFYRHILRPLLFKLPAETSHNLVLRTLGYIHKLPFGGTLTKLSCSRNHKSLKTNLFGIDFPHPVGLAAGIDPDGEHYNELAWFGFSFVEIGSLTTEPQEGNPKPRIFRLSQDEALINRVGLGNKGIKNAIEHLKKDKPRTIISASITKNPGSVSEAEIQKDYITAFSLLYDFVDMFTVNVSPMNVNGVNHLQDASNLADVLDQLLDLRICYETYRPILVKISPDIPDAELDEILKYCMISGIDGIVACNASTEVEGLNTDKDKLEKIGAGAISGAPIFEKSLQKVRHIHEFTKGRLPIIGVGGIMTPEQAKEMIDAGASLIELCSGFVYNGPHLVKKILKCLAQANQS